MKTLLESLGSIARPSGEGLVLRPQSERELASALMVLRDRQLAFGDGVTLDRSGFDRLGRLDDRSMTIEVGAGISVRELEARVNQQKLTLGALAPGAWDATVGSLVEDSALGFRVIVPGRLEPLALRVTGVLPDGAIVTSSPGPRHAVGPDLASLLIGGGGALGLVTSATLRLMPQPEAEQRRLYSFASHADALEALREALSAGASFARVVVRGRAGRTIVEITVRGSTGQLERELALISRCAETTSGRFEGQGREAEVDGPAHEATWSDLASALAQGASVELFRVSLSTVIARGVGVRSFLPPSPLMRSLKDVFDRARVLGEIAVTDQRRIEQATSTCSFCPKACRFSCPVSEATQNESLSAWGKMSAAHHVVAEHKPIDVEVSAAVHACTGCGRCTSFCKHENDVGPTLFAARGEAVKAGLQPRGAASTLATFHQAQNPFGRELGSLVASWRAQRPVRYPLFPGCSTLVKRPGLLEQTIAVSDAFGAPMGVAKSASKCCGYPLYAAGSFDAFSAHAKSVAEAFVETPEVAVLDAGCAFTFRKLYPEFGVRLPTRIRTVIEVLHENLPHAPDRKPLPQRVGYHDACHLGRGLGLYDEPRALLARAVTTIVEAPSVRREGGCAGGGGLLPRTMVETSVEMARRQALEISDDANVAMVTGCPTSTRMFERAGRRAMDLISVLEQWVTQP